MKFVKLSNRWINMDLVTDIEAAISATLNVTLAVTEDIGETNPLTDESHPVTTARVLVLSGDDVKTLRRWLEYNTDLNIEV